MVTLFRRSVQLYIRAGRLLFRVGARLILPSTILLILSGFIPALYPALTWLQVVIVQSLVSIALVPAIAATARQQVITITEAYRSGLFRYGVTVVAGALFGILLLLPCLFLLGGFTERASGRAITSFGVADVVGLIGGIILVGGYCSGSFILVPVAVLNRGGPGSVVGRTLTLLLRHGWFVLVVFLATTLVTIGVNTIPASVMRWGWTALFRAALLPIGAPARWIEWILFIVIQQALLLLTLPIQPIVSTLWYLDLRHID